MKLFRVLPVLAGSLTWATVGVPAADTAMAANSTGPDNPFLFFFGRWDRSAERAITVNTGSEIIVSFAGTGVTFRFDMSIYKPPLPRLWLRLDEGDWREIEIADAIQVKAPSPAGRPHVARIVVKGLREKVRRWTPPLESAVIFKGLALGEGTRLLPPPPPPQRRIEFLGDSITEGILAVRKGDRSDWPSICDGRRAYAFRTAELLGFEPRIVGFGRQGIIVAGNGGVPRAVESFPYVYQGVKKDRWRPTAVVINFGTNDSKARPRIFLDEYYLYVRKVRQSYKRAHIFCMRPFNGTHDKSIRAAVKRLQAAGDKRVHYVDTTGWINPLADTTDGVHPNIEGHRKIAEKLAPIIRAALRPR